MRFLLLLAFIPFISTSQVIGSDNHGFQIKLESEVNTDKATAYQQLLNISQWWDAEHTWFGSAEKLTIDANVGGCFCEIDGDKQAMHMTVSYIDPNNEIRMTGGLGPLHLMGIQGGMSWKFETIAPARTKIIFHYQASGYVNGGLTKLAPFVDKVQRLQMSRLTELLNTGKIVKQKPTQ
ncbi:MAG: hypothetical protein ACPG52_05825 [Cognaticolwellia sp.]